MPKTALMGSPLCWSSVQYSGTGAPLRKLEQPSAVILMLPILFLSCAGTRLRRPLSENTGALTNSTVISENIRASNQAIVEVLQESHDALLAQDQCEIARLWKEILPLSAILTLPVSS